MAPMRPVDSLRFEESSRPGFSIRCGAGARQSRYGRHWLNRRNAMRSGLVRAAIAVGVEGTLLRRAGRDGLDLRFTPFFPRHWRPPPSLAAQSILKPWPPDQTECPVVLLVPWFTPWRSPAPWRRGR
jgi:hypothetical protein